MLKCAFVSDTHNNYPIIPKCDLLIHAGDLTGMGTFEEIEKGLEWLSNQPAKFKILVPGNHDWEFQIHPIETRKMCKDQGVELLIDEEITYFGKRIYGSPWQPAFGYWAFNLNPGLDIREKWNRIPRGGQIDILVTHGPAAGVLDDVGSRSAGGMDLRDAIKEVAPVVHVFGHMHQQNGIHPCSLGQTHYLAVNAALCDEQYRCVNPVQIIWL